jgi:hypothetical protein
LQLFIKNRYSCPNRSHVLCLSLLNKYENFKVCKFFQIIHFILKFESYQKYYANYFRLNCFLYHKLHLCFVCNAHYTPFTCGKGFWKFKNLKTTWNLLKSQIPYLFNYYYFLDVGSRLLSSKMFYHQNYVITIILYLVLCKINHNLM